MKTNWIYLVLLVVLGAAAVHAQPPVSAEARKAEMQKVAKLAGTWKGSGWIQSGPTRETFTGGEIVQVKLDGLAVLVEGRFLNGEGKVVHETLAVLSSDRSNTGYDFATYLANGMSGVYAFKVVGDHYEWGFEIPNYGTFRYKINISNTTWHEIGEFSRDGKTWTQNFEMTLEKK